MFGSSSNSPGPKSESDTKSDQSPSPEPGADPEVGQTPTAPTPIKTSNQAASGEKRCGNGSPPTRNDTGGSIDKKRRSSSVSSKASSLLASAKSSLSFSQSGRNSSSEVTAQTPLQKLGKQDHALAVPQGQHNNSAGESMPGPKSTFRVGVWEDRNKKCRRTMEDTHAFLYNFLHIPAIPSDAVTKDQADNGESETGSQEVVETDNGYFAIFDGHAGTFAADWCGKKLHIILEELIRKNPTALVPEILDQTFTAADVQLEKLPLKNSGCTAAVAVLRWEDRATQAGASAAKPIKSDDTQSEKDNTTAEGVVNAPSELAQTKSKPSPSRQRVLYTANVGDARIILCRNGKALRLSYDHKGSDENEGKRIANAGGLILNNRVNGVLAVTRALGDAYMKKLVTGHPYTTETVIQPDSDEFIIIACDGLWDVCSDQEAVDFVRNVEDPVAAAKQLVDHALNRFSTDNLSCMIIRLDRVASQQRLNSQDAITDVDGGAIQVSEADKIVNDTKQNIAQGNTPAIGVSASNSGRGHDPVLAQEGEFVPTSLDETVVEEADETPLDGDSPEASPAADKKAAEVVQNLKIPSDKLSK